MKDQFLDEDESLIPDKRVSLIPAPLSCSVSWHTGTEAGPRALLQASRALESFDDELLVDTFRAGFDTLPELRLENLSSEEACGVIGTAVRNELSRGRLPVILGGEHTVTLPAVAACAEKYPGLHVVQFDAHLDLRDSYEGNPLSHACVMRRISDLGISFTQIGIRSFSREEWDFVSAGNLQPFTMKRLLAETDCLEAICASISGPVYITFDLDVLDPSVMPATGTPEPGGMTWREAVDIIEVIAANFKIAGLDFVELAPRPGLHHADFTAAKLIYRTLGFIFRDFLLKQETTE